MRFYLLLFLNFIVCGCDKVELHQKGTLTGITAFKVSRTPGQKECVPGWQKGVRDDTFYETCAAGNVPDNNQCSIKSEYWPITGSNVKIVYINVSGNGLNCKFHKHRCSSQFELRAYTGVEGGALDNNYYKTISMVPFKTEVDANYPSFYNFNEVHSIDVTGKSALSILFRTTYFCGQIKEVNIYYYTCSSVSKGLVQFPLHNAPDEQRSPSRITGKCVDHSVQKSPKLTMLCYFNGTSIVSGECQCEEGYEVGKKKCQECKGKTFKPNVGNTEKCRSCGRNALVVDKRRCNCKEKYYRAIGKEIQDEADCYRPPSAPSVKEIRNRKKNSVTIEFKQFSSSEIGDGSAVTIILNCSTKSCPPMSMTITQVSDWVFNVTGLRSFTEYFLVANPTNNVTRLTGNINSLEFNFTTKEGVLAKDTTHIIAIAVGVAVAVVVLIFVVVMLLRNRNHKNASTSGDEVYDDVYANADQGDEGNVTTDNRVELEQVNQETENGNLPVYEYIDTIQFRPIPTGPAYNCPSNLPSIPVTVPRYERPINSPSLNDHNVYDRLQFARNQDYEAPLPRNQTDI